VRSQILRFAAEQSVTSYGREFLFLLRSEQHRPAENLVIG